MKVMGDSPLIPLSESIKTKMDVAAAPAAMAGFLGAIPWPTIAAVLSSIYLTLRIAETLSSWWKRRKHK